MSCRGQYRPALKRCRPAGFIAASPNDTAAEIVGRMAKAPRGPDCHLTVFVADGKVYATRSSSPISAAVGAKELVGLYTHRAEQQDIADDIEAWRESA